jgi:hypothetical protein
MISSVHVLFVAWQDPESRRIFPVARLLRRVSGLYEFAYLRAVREAQASGFVGLPGFEDLERIYSSPTLPELFERRGSRFRRSPAATPPDRATHEPAAEVIDATPISVFVRRPERATAERLEVFAPPLLEAGNARYWGVFEARGVGRVQGAPEILRALQPGEPLLLRAEPDNAYNPAALLIERADHTPLGYVPDYLANELAAAQARPGDLELELLEAERVTFPPAPVAYRVSCRYRCSAELGRRLFASDRYDLVARPPRPPVH